MFLSIWQLNEALVAYFELLWFHSCEYVHTYSLQCYGCLKLPLSVHVHVFCNLKTNKPFITVLGLVWFKSCVCSFMPPARWWPEEAFITILARVTFNTCMSKFVFFVLQYLSEALVTKLALIRLQSGVSKFMFLTMCWATEAFITILALMRFFS